MDDSDHYDPCKFGVAASSGVSCLLCVLVTERPAHWADHLALGLSDDGRNRHLERLCRAAELGPGGVAQAALYAREIGRVQIGGMCERFDGQFSAVAQSADGSSEGGVGGCLGGRGGPRPISSVPGCLEGHLPVYLAEADGGAGGEHEVAGAVDESDVVEVGESVGRCCAVAVFADDLIDRPGALLFGVE